MSERTNTPHSFPMIWTVAATTGGVLFLLGAIAATDPTTLRLAMAGGAIAFTSLGIYTAILLRRNNGLTQQHAEMASELVNQQHADRPLRTRMAHTLRQPLGTVVGFSDYLERSPELSFAQQHKFLVAMRNDAREVELALSDLANLDAPLANYPPIRAVVLLEEEADSIASMIMTDTNFEADLTTTRAWADSAKVRQILRTMLLAATNSGCKTLTIHTAERSNRATVSISGRADLLTPREIAALIENAVTEESENHAYRALRTAYEIAVSMEGSISYQQALGRSQIILDLPLAPGELRVPEPLPRVKK